MVVPLKPYPKHHESHLLSKLITSVWITLSICYNYLFVVHYILHLFSLVSYQLEVWCFWLEAGRQADVKDRHAHLMLWQSSDGTKSLYKQEHCSVLMMHSQSNSLPHVDGDFVHLLHICWKFLCDTQTKLGGVFINSNPQIYCILQL